MTLNVEGNSSNWTALTYFRFDGEGKVVEEIVVRHELFETKNLGIFHYD